MLEQEKFDSLLNDKKSCVGKKGVERVEMELFLFCRHIAIGKEHA